MKHIIKRSDVAELRSWKSANSELPHVIRYNQGGFPSSAVKNALLSDQHSICAYTMLRISFESCHIEHLIPQSYSKKSPATQHLETEFSNMLACYPKSGDGKVACKFGAVHKAGMVPDDGNFISPLNRSCETRFQYNRDGTVTPASDADLAAAECIRALNLNDSSLIELRVTAFLRLGILRRSKKPLTEMAARRLADTIINPDQANQLGEFCTAVVQVAIRYADIQNKRGAMSKTNKTRLR